MTSNCIDQLEKLFAAINQGIEFRRADVITIRLRVSFKKSNRGEEGVQHEAIDKSRKYPFSEICKREHGSLYKFTLGHFHSGVVNHTNGWLTMWRTPPPPPRIIFIQELLRKKMSVGKLNIGLITLLFCSFASRFENLISLSLLLVLNLRISTPISLILWACYGIWATFFLVNTQILSLFCSMYRTGSCFFG